MPEAVKEIRRSVQELGAVAVMVPTYVQSGMDLGQPEFDPIYAEAQELGAKGLVWAFREGEGWRSPTAKFLAESELRALNERFGALKGTA